MTYIAPVAQWPEPPSSSAAIALTLLTAYLLTDGSVEFLSRTDTVPVGAIEASVIDDEIVTPVIPTGRRIVESVSSVFLV